MSLTIDITTHGEAALSKLEQLNLKLHGGEELNRYMADGAVACVQRHFKANAGREKNPFGARSGFWNRMLSGARAFADASRAGVSMPREVAQRYYGGDITPKRGRFLSIPARTEAYNKSPRQFRDLQFVPTGPDKGMLVQREQTTISIRRTKRGMKVRAGKEIGGGTFYFLVPLVTQDPDRRVLPGEGELGKWAADGLRRFFRKVAA